MRSAKSRNSTILRIKLIMQSLKEYFDILRGLSMWVSPSVGVWDWNWNYIVMQIGQMERIGSRYRHTLSFWQEERCPGDRRNNQQSHRQARKPNIWRS